MAIKAFLVPAILGAAGTTTIALPSAWAYGKGKANSITNFMDQKIKELDEGNEKLRQGNIQLQKDEQKEKTEAEGIRKQLEGKQKEIDELNATNKASQEKYTKAWADHNTLWDEHKKFKREKEEADQESETLRAKVTPLEQELTNAKQETSKVKAKNSRGGGVFDRVQQEIEKLDKQENQSSLYSYLTARIGEGGSQLQPIAQRQWKCKEITWTKETGQEGIAYCVISQAPSDVQYTINTEVKWSGDWGTPPKNMSR